MNKSRRLLNLFENVLGKSMTSGNEATFSCPYCNHHKKKLVINIITQKSILFLFSKLANLNIKNINVTIIMKLKKVMTQQNIYLANKDI